MLRHFLTTAWKNISRRKSSHSLHVLGLTLGMTACLLIGKYVYFELSYEDFQPYKDRLCRVKGEYFQSGESILNIVTTPSQMGPQLKEDFPEVVDFVRLHGNGGVVQFEDQSIREKWAIHADSNFFELFNFPLVEGKSTEVLKNPSSAVLTISKAQQYFGTENPIGKVLIFHGMFGKQTYQVTGIAQDLPANTHLKSDIFLSIHDVVTAQGGPWNGLNFYSYVLMQDAADHSNLINKLPEFMDRHLKPIYDKSNLTATLDLQPIESIHLYSDFQAETRPPGDATMVYALIGIAGMILLLAWINYMNLASAHALNRFKEIGIRKILGASQNWIRGQILSETLLVSLIGMIASIFLAIALLPAFSALTEIPLAETSFQEPWIVYALIAMVVGGSIISGIYPAWLMGSFSAKSVIVGKENSIFRRSGISMRKFLIGFQLASSVLLIMGTLSVQAQLSYMNDKELGVNLNQLLVIKGPILSEADSIRNNQLIQLKQSLSLLPEIQGVSFSSMVPSQPHLYGREGIKRLDYEPKKNLSRYYFFSIDEHYAPMYEMKFLAGQNFDSSFGKADQHCLINRTALLQFEFESPESAIGSQISTKEGIREIIGVLEDYHQEGLKLGYKPFIYHFQPHVSSNITLKISPKEWEKLHTKIEQTYQGIFPDNPFEFFFVDQHFSEQYKKEQRLSKLMLFASGFAVIVAMLGLLGLAIYAANVRKKEFGIRKVLGAHSFHLIYLMNREIFLLLFISGLLTIPLGSWIIGKWLETFAFRIEESWILGLGAIFMVGMTSLLVVSYHTWKAIHTDPVEVIRENA